MKVETVLPEVTLLYDARGSRPENAVGVGDFWYEPEVWSLPLSPVAKVLYAGLCSFLGHGQINRKDLRGTLKNSTDEEIAAAHEELVHHGLLVPADEVVSSGDLSGYVVRSVKEFESCHALMGPAYLGRMLLSRQEIWQSVRLVRPPLPHATGERRKVHEPPDYA